MALIYLLSALALGATLVRRVPFALYRFEAVAAAIVVGLLGWIWLAFALLLVLPYDVALPLVVVASLVVTVVLWRGPSPGWRPLEGGRRAWVVWGVATTLTSALVARLFWTHSLPREADGIWSVGATWADFGLHSTLVTEFAAGSRLSGDLPIASGEQLTYPLLVDLLSGIYLQGGMSLHGSLFWPGVLLALAICQLLISVGLRLFQQIWVGVGGLWLALTCGSFAGVGAAWGDWRASGLGLGEFLTNLPADYSQDDESNAHLTNLLVDAIIPQRSILLGLGVGLVVWTLLIVARGRGDAVLLWPAAALVGLLPMAHPHTFVVMVALFATVVAEAAWRARAIPWAHLSPISLIAALALPQLIWQQAANSNGTGGRFRLFWQHQEGESLAAYWWANFGLMGLALLAAPLLLRRDPRVRWMLPMLGVWVITQVYAFQPFEYDNLKLIYWVYVVGGFFIAHLAVELVRRVPLALALVLPVAAVVAVPGTLAITRDLTTRYLFAGPADIELADWARSSTAPGAVFAAADRPNVPVATLAGRSLVMGYRGWLYNFNLPYDEREAAVRAALAGRFDDPLLDRFGADYVLVSFAEDPYWGVDYAALSAQPVVWSNSTWTVYALP
ncbi:hypothetical protein [Nocardioides sp.]|uniref:hypothetical protein n=1 Tax=Nocardioides sp. TaxID=35761 RepID=UPI002B26F404|nr:hypothetical protein [Nocardioides sp.]